MSRRHRQPASALLHVLCASLVLSSCGQSPERESVPPSDRPQTLGPESDSPSGATEVDLQPGRGLLLGSPVFDGDFADPFVLSAEGTFYGYATNTVDDNIPTLSFRPGGRAAYEGDALPELPSWTTPGRVWAPAVYDTGEDFVMYYTTTVTSLGRQCISAATSDSPTGPFRDRSDGPLICQVELGGSIDPSVVVDDNDRPWLLYKNDGNCCDLPTSIWSTRLSADGRRVIGEPHELMTSDAEWQQGLIEGPAMVPTPDGYVLFYSANAWDSADYSIGFALCDTISGPCEPSPRPWMGSRSTAQGPGGQEFFEAAGLDFMVYAAWDAGQVGYPDGARRLYIDQVDIRNGVPQRVGRRNATGILALSVLLAGLGTLAAVAALLRRRARRRTEGD